MQNKLASFLEQYHMVSPGDTVICALSGGADSVALVFAFYLLREDLDIRLEAAHFNHHLRGQESDRDEEFVRALCSRLDIPLHLGWAQVQPGEKGLEAAAREARYGFLRGLSGKIATAHTADDNAETVLMHLIRGTGLKGLGAIAPVNGSVIRPMLSVTRAEVEEFLAEYYMPHVEDSSNGSDEFLRNRIRHHVMPLLQQENPRIAENLSRMALRLREDESCLAELSRSAGASSIPQLRAMEPALRSRALEQFLKENRVKEPEDAHIALLEALVFSPKPSARASFPGNVTIGRQYDHLTVIGDEGVLPEQILPCPGTLEAGGWRITCTPAREILCTRECFTVCPRGRIRVTSRRSGDRIALAGGSKSLKKLYIDRKIPALRRPLVPVLRDDAGVLGVGGIGASLDRIAESLPAVTIRFQEI